MNCRDCSHWTLRDTMRIHPDIARQGFAKCAKAEEHKKVVFYAAGYYCNGWDEAPEAAVQARKKVMGEK